MKKRTGLDAIAYLHDVLHEQTATPAPSVTDWPWLQKKLSKKPKPADPKSPTNVVVLPATR